MCKWYFFLENQCENNFSAMFPSVRMLFTFFLENTFYKKIYSTHFFVLYFYQSNTKLQTPKMKQLIQHVPNAFLYVLHSKKSLWIQQFHSTNTQNDFSFFHFFIFSQKPYVTLQRGRLHGTKIMKWNEIFAQILCRHVLQ